MSHVLSYAINHMVAPGRSFAELVELASSVGLDQVEIRNDLPGVAMADGTPPARVREDAEAAGVRILSINALQRFNDWSDERAGEVSFAPGSCGWIVARGGAVRAGRRLEAVLPDATVVKLDIEGTEFALFPGQIDRLPTAHTWIVEIHPAKGRDPRVILDAFAARGFALWWVDRSKRRVAPYPGHATWPNRTSLIALRS